MANILWNLLNLKSSKIDIFSPINQKCIFIIRRSIFVHCAKSLVGMKRAICWQNVWWKMPLQMKSLRRNHRTQSNWTKIQLLLVSKRGLGPKILLIHFLQGMDQLEFHCPPFSAAGIHFMIWTIHIQTRKSTKCSANSTMNHSFSR